MTFVPLSDTPIGKNRYAIDLCVHLVGREFRSRYRRSLLGWFWSVALPLFRFVVLGVVFGKLLKNNTPNFASFLFSGLIFWQWFTSGVASATRSALHRSELLLRPGLPRWTIPLTSVLTDGIDLVASLPVLLLVVVLDGGSLTPWLLLLPVALGIQLLLILGLGMLFCAGNVYFRDVGFVVDISLLMGFYVTPIFYDIGAIPKDWRWLIEWNPMTALLKVQRDLVLFGQAPSLPSTLRVFAFSLVTFAVGALVYKRASAGFVDEL